MFVCVFGCLRAFVYLFDCGFACLFVNSRVCVVASLLVWCCAGLLPLLWYSLVVLRLLI